jgi:hypothetical protein
MPFPSPHANMFSEDHFRLNSIWQEKNGEKKSFKTVLNNFEAF